MRRLNLKDYRKQIQLVGATANPPKSDDWKCLTHKGTFIINDFLRKSTLKYVLFKKINI